MDVTLAKVIDPTQLPDDASVLKALIAQLLDSMSSLRREKEQIEHRLQQLLRARFGQKAEKIDPAQMALFAQQILTELQKTEPPPQEPAGEPPAPRPGHGRKKLPRHLPRKTVEIDVPPEDRKCKCCGQEMTRIGQETREQIEFFPASLYVLETVRPKYACKHCPDGTVVTADQPRQPIEKGLPGPGMLAHVAVSKFCDHIPLNRQSGMFARQGLDLAPSTLGGWMGSAAKLTESLVDVMIERVLTSAVIQTDDTPVPVLDKNLDSTRKGRLWIYRGDDLNPYTVYDYTPSRARDGPAEFLGKFQGYLQADAYGGYDGIYLASEDKVIEVLCWAHARRKHFDAQDSDLARATIALAYIRRLYQVEREAKEFFQRQEHDQAARPLSAIRLELRQRDSLPVLEAFEAWMRQQACGVADDGSPLPAGPVLPKSPLGMAINYCLGNWKALTRYASDGKLEIDNNASERDLRPVAIGRNNYTFFGSDNGGRTAAVLYSLIASAKRHGLDPFVYLRDVLARISDHPSNKLHELLPDQWKLARSAAAAEEPPPSPQG
jgi:transposase